MKRLILRIGALVTVVILGLIAIAQAQRGTKDSPSPALELARADKMPSVQGTPAVLDPQMVSAAKPLKRATVVSKSNPLRNRAGKAVVTETALPTKVPTSGRTSAPRDMVPTLAKRPSATDPFPQRREAAVPIDGPTIPVSSEVYDAAAADNPPGQFALNEPGNVDPAGQTSIGPGVDEVPVAGSLETMEVGEPAPLGAEGFPSPNDAGLEAGVLPDSEMAPAGAAMAGEGTGRPGGEELEGPQTPQLTIQKIAPEQIQVGKPATFQVIVRNAGSIAANGVEVRDQIPKGTRLIGTTPTASRGVRGELIWPLGTIKPGEELTVEVQLEPIMEGEIGSVATVSFNANASARSIATKPDLVLESVAAEQVLIGEKLMLKIKIFNQGSGTANDVVLVESIPAGLQHPDGPELEYKVGDLPPGESRELELTLFAAEAGKITNVLTARGDGDVHIEDRLDLEVVAPQLEVAMAGPKKRYLERKATYKLSVHNPGTAAAEQVELVAYLPSGLKFVSANNAGYYEEADQTVHWVLEELPTQETGEVELVAMPIKSGEHILRVSSTAERGLSAEKEQPLMIEGIAAIMFEVIDVTDPVEVGGETMYEIRVLNQGTKAASNVRLAVILPVEMQAIAAEGPTRHVVEGTRVIFDALGRLAPKADTTFRVRVKSSQPGDLRVRVQLLTDDMNAPVTKEESTRVYTDE